MQTEIYDFAINDNDNLGNIIFPCEFRNAIQIQVQRKGLRYSETCFERKQSVPTSFSGFIDLLFKKISKFLINVLSHKIKVSNLVRNRKDSAVIKLNHKKGKNEKG